MEQDSFIDYYELLGLDPGADVRQIAQRFHRLAKRFHPDNPLTGNRDSFDLFVKAHSILRDAAKRAEYDKRHEQVIGRHPRQSKEPSNEKTVGRDVETQERLLSVLYARRRGNIRSPGVSEFEMEQVLNCTAEELEFHLWYMRAKQWIDRLDNGMMAITVEGVDHVNNEHRRQVTTKLLTDGSQFDDEQT